jgi:phenylpropionate dioxygenase-like ring-hydroxylating dioxygenase large terminal subunit
LIESIAGLESSASLAGNFVRNCWYVAAHEDELDQDFISRRILDEPVLLFRTSAGSIAAIADRCPHRLVPLSIGKRSGDAMQCGYHGTVVSADGRCLSIPGQTHIPRDSGTVSYPALARHALVWIWMGDRGLADERLVPDMRWLVHPQWATAKGYLRIEADYRLVTDNLLDLSHETYIHGSSIGNAEGESIANFPAAVTIEDDCVVHARRDMYGITPPPAWTGARQISGTIDRLQIATYQPPGINMTEAGYRPHGSGVDYIFLARVMHLLTPERANSTHYFFTVSRNYRSEDTALTAAIAAGNVATFKEDQLVLELQQKALLERGDDRVPNMVIGLDGAAIQGRRLLERAIQRERSDPQSAVLPFPLVPDIARWREAPAVSS